MTAPTTAPKQPSPKAKGMIRRSPKRVSKLVKADIYYFNSCVDCYLCQPATPSPKEAKKNGERIPQSERIRK